MRQSSQVVVITGASAGIGRATAREFARRGARIALLARGEEGLDAASREVDELGGRGLAIPCDVANEAEVETAADRAERELGPIDVWINNAMVSIMSPFDQITPEEYRRVTDVTYLGQVWGAMAALKRMRPRDRGSIVFVGSALAYRGIPLQSAYCGAKHGVQGLCDSLRSELLHDKSRIKVSMVQLPGVNTPQFEWIRTNLPRKPRPLGAVYQPEVAARAIAWAADHDRREVYVGLPSLTAIVGNKVAPGAGDWYLSRVGYKGQQRDEPVSPHRRSNLWEPLPGDHGAHGEFDAESREFSPQLWATTHRGIVATGLLALGAVAAGTIMAARR